MKRSVIVGLAVILVLIAYGLYVAYEKGMILYIPADRGGASGEL